MTTASTILHTNQSPARLSSSPEPRHEAIQRHAEQDVHRVANAFYHSTIEYHKRDNGYAVAIDPYSFQDDQCDLSIGYHAIGFIANKVFAILQEPPRTATTTESSRPTC